jgi:hypothetical protein
MSHGLFKVFTTQIASAATSSFWDFGDQAPFEAYLHHSTMSTNTAMYIQASIDGETYYPIYQRPFNTLSTAPMALEISSAMTGMWYPIPIPSRYLAITATQAADTHISMTVICVHK